MFEADSQNFASAPSVPRGFKLQNLLARLWRGPYRDPGRRGGGSAPPPPLSSSKRPGLEKANASSLPVDPLNRTSVQDLKRRMPPLFQYIPAPMFSGGAPALHGVRGDRRLLLHADVR